MKKSIKVEEATDVLVQVGVEEPKVEEFKRRIAEFLNQEKEEKEPKPKKQYVFVKDESAENMGWVVQIEETENPNSVLEKLTAVKEAFNNSKKGRRLPVENTTEMFEAVPRKFWVEQKIWPKHKERIYIVGVEK